MSPSKTHLFRRTVVPALLLSLAALVGPAAEASDQGVATTGVQGALSTTTFELPEGSVTVYLPSDLRAGDTLSGTVVATPKGDSDAQRQANLTALDSLSFELASVSGTVQPKNPRGRRWVLPATIGGAAVTIAALGQGGSTAASATLPLSSDTTQPPSGYSLPRHSAARAPITIRGPFDGDASSTTVDVADQPAVVIAESPRMIAAVPSGDAQGPVEVSVTEGDRTVSGSTRVVTTNLSADKLDLAEGETATVECLFGGLEEMDAGETIQFRMVNLYPEVVTLEGGDTQTIEIGADEVSTDGTATRRYIVRGKRPGGYTVSTDLVQSDEPEPMQPVATPSGGDEEPTLWPAIAGIAVPLVGTQFSLPRQSAQGAADAVPISAEGDCDEDIPRLMTMILEFQKLIDATREELMANPLVKEALTYQLMLDVINGDPAAYKAIEKLLQGKVNEFIEDLKGEVNLRNALKLLDKLLELVIEKDSSLKDRQRTLLKNLKAKVEMLIATEKDAAEIQKELETTINAIKEAIDNPLSYLEEQIKAGIEDSIERMLVKALGAKAAGAIMSMAVDAANFVDALIKKDNLDELRQKLQDAKKQLTLRARENDCFRLDGKWNDRVNPYLFFNLAKMGDSVVTLTPTLMCWDEGKKKFVQCPEPKIKIETPNGYGMSVKENLPAKADKDPYKIHFELDLSNVDACGTICYVRIEVVVEPNDPSKEGEDTPPLWVGALPAPR